MIYFLRGIALYKLEAAMLSAQIRSKLSFWEDIVLRKQLISPVSSSSLKSSKKGIVLHCLGNRKICEIFSSTLALHDFRKVDLSPKLLEKLSDFFSFYLWSRG